LINNYCNSPIKVQKIGELIIMIISPNAEGKAYEWRGFLKLLKNPI
jgi:hypothetical protein